MMLEFALRRVSLLVFMLFTLSVFFSLGYLFPGDPLTNFSGIETVAFRKQRNYSSNTIWMIAM